MKGVIACCRSVCCLAFKLMTCKFAVGFILQHFSFAKTKTHSPLSKDTEEAIRSGLQGSASNSGRLPRQASLPGQG